MAGAMESLVYTPVLSGEYYIVVKRATEATGGGQFSLTSTPSQTVHILLSVSSAQSVYAKGQSLTLKVTVDNELNPELDSTLTFSVTGPGGYYKYDFQPMAVGANEIKDNSFSWTTPDIAGTYMVEVSLIPAQLTAYDTSLIKVT